MLLQFSVENFLSFKEKAVLKLEPSKDREHAENINIEDGYKGLNSVVIYGPNAAGKTNLHKAMTLALIMVRGSNLRQVNEQLPISPFRFSKASINKPSKFEFQFIASDNKKYVYGFSASNKRIFEEYLYRYSSRRPTKIFERKIGEIYEFTAREKNILEPLTQMNTPNKFFIATATMWNAQSTKVPFEWLATRIDTYSDLGEISEEVINKYQGNRAKEYIDFTEQIMKEADVNISKIDVNVRKMPINPNIMPMVPGIVINGQLIQPQEHTQLDVKMYHEIKDENGNVVETGVLMLGDESRGTQILFAFSPTLKQVFETGKTIIVDEIERSLHPLVVKHIINMFRDKSINKKGAQLIFSTHNTSFLNLSMFRRDQIYFVSKDNNKAESTLYCIDELSVRKGENIEKGYLVGRYGAVPDIKGGEII